MRRPHVFLSSKATRTFFETAMQLLAALSLAMPLVALMGVAPALACSGPGVPPPAERFAPAVSAEVSGIEPSGIALLGVVLGEALLAGPGLPATPMFLSNVQTVVPLAGESITPVVRVGPNGFGAPDCSGGPRLFAGEKVMLFLYASRGVLGTQRDQSQYGDWQSGQFGTPILFDGDDAYYLSWARYSGQGNGPDQEQRWYVGKSEDVLRLALTHFTATPAEREQAFQFVLGTTAGAQIMPPKAGDGGLESTRR